MGSTDLAKKYQKLTDAEHVLTCPGMYVGSIQKTIDSLWLLDKKDSSSEKKDSSSEKKDSSSEKKVSSSETVGISEKNIEYVPAFLKLFDEIATNSCDQSRENKETTKIDIIVTEEYISIYNNGPGIPIEKHPKYGVYIPELIFANFKTSTNYDKSEKKLKGGKNGYGSKIVAAFSLKFIVETVSSGKEYKQVYENNLRVINPPSIKSTQKKDGTKITFYPDLSRFEMKKINQQMISVFEKRTLDLCACTEKTVNFTFNGVKCGIKSFDSYINLYIPDTQTKKIIIERPRWKVAFLLNPFDKFTQVSFVNGLATLKGGTHVEHVIRPVIKKVVDQLSAKHKDIEIKPNYVKDNLLIFVIALIENPDFNSQSKEELTSRVQDFGSRCDITEEEIKHIIKLGIDKNILAIAQAKSNKALTATDGKKRLKVNVPKLDDANCAGGKRSTECTLILTEGDSAKTFAVSGIGKIGRDMFGIFPLKGKLLNVRHATVKQLSSNEEIINLKAILGLQHGKTYKTLEDMKKDMRYGKILLLTDQDLDGAHIKGLLINFFHHFWPLLITDDDFITCLQTPIVKCTKGSSQKIFYNIPEYETWKQTNNGWKVKYYKGLGTSSAKEARECFDGLTSKQVYFTAETSEDIEAIDLAFNKDRPDDRKKWIQDSTGKKLFLDNKLRKVSLNQFFNEEFVLFSIADCIRSIPNIMDGLKPSQRKVLYGCLKKNIKDEIKVDQIRGYIGEHTAYHHGDKSLNETIIAMNHDFVGSNNINLLNPSGQLGTRLKGGADAASPRYVSTQLNPLTRKIFMKEDDPLLVYLNEDGYNIEPEYYWPVIPMLLVNGTSGIGTGYSTDIPCYNPSTIIDILLNLIDDEEYDIPKMIPWYKNFKGSIFQKEHGGNFNSFGVWKRVTRTEIRVSELPIGMWTENYKELLEKYIEAGKIDNFRNNSSEITIDFTLIMSAIQIDKMIKDNSVEQELGLVTTIKSSNMTVFDHKNRLISVSGPEEIIYSFFKQRKKLYIIRYNHLKELYEKNLLEINAKLKFIKGIIEDTIKVFRIPKSQIILQLQTLKFPTVDNDYEYLLSMKISSFTEEKMKELELDFNKEEKNLKDLVSKTPTDLWIQDIKAISE